MSKMIKLFRSRLTASTHEDHTGLYQANDPKNNVVTSTTNWAKEMPERFVALEPIMVPEETVTAAQLGFSGNNKNEAPKTQQQLAQEVLQREQEKLASEQAPSPTGGERGTLESMTVAELRQHAEESEIDLEGCTKKDEIINAIMAANV